LNLDPPDLWLPSSWDYRLIHHIQWEILWGYVSIPFLIKVAWNNYHSVPRHWFSNSSIPSSFNC
jgi:hypothetical protein